MTDKTNRPHPNPSPRTGEGLLSYGCCGLPETFPDRLPLFSRSIFHNGTIGKTSKANQYAAIVSSIGRAAGHHWQRFSKNLASVQ
ncbi:MAG: hypothetical protein HC780_20145 [Leptolyngbyaceae cyanobacterium CSU_1_3]|nr:hypothetical protein [Leptolyngbyaceae cyanobacterium CSU_1_3]